MRLTPEQVKEKLQKIASTGMCRRKNGELVNEPFLFAVDATNENRVSIHGYQFHMDALNKMMHVLNRANCEFWIYPSTVIDGYTMLVVTLFHK
ncbi:hypothetical protein GCM10028807_50120 [Spirosoma daeguense]